MFLAFVIDFMYIAPARRSSISHSHLNLDLYHQYSVTKVALNVNLKCLISVSLEVWNFYSDAPLWFSSLLEYYNWAVKPDYLAHVVTTLICDEYPSGNLAVNG